MGSRAGGRDRFSRDYPPSRSDEKPRTGRPKAPPSRHLWVGNLSHDINESDLTEHFVRFGELDSVAFHPGRSYAFINFVNDDDAIAAFKALQGLSLAGSQLKIEFAKADKPSTLSHDEDRLHHRRDESRSSLRESPFSPRDSRARHGSPDSYYPEKTRMSDRNVEPGEVLWIGFPPLLKVDEIALRKAFQPFGELEKVTVFPGRSYAFVRYRSVMSACRAKETLQGKLFGNPRVQICFAKSEATSSSENFRRDKQMGSILGDPRKRSPLISSLDSGDFDMPNLSRRGSSWTGENDEFEPRLYGESDLGPPPDIYECRSSPLRERGDRERGDRFHDFPERFSRKSPHYEDPWDLPEDNLMRGAKKLKTSSFPPDQELPDHPYSRLEREKPAFVRPLSDFPPQPESFDRRHDPEPFGYKQVTDQHINLPPPRGDRSDQWKAPYDNFPTGSLSLPANTVERKRFTPEPEPKRSSSLPEWKWEGTIAKGGTPVCRARCFPVGKVLDMMLPEFLDCTARTGLDMLSKHYYQAAGAWVVFFVPGSDADMVFYNEFMHYLEEKQRAAVAKLDDKTTLFLVPPSDFSEKVLKVPGKLSISGVILRLGQPGSNFEAPHHPKEPNEANTLPVQGDPSYPRPTKQPLGSNSFPSMASYPDSGKSGVSNNQSFLGSAGSSASAGSSYGSNPFQWNASAGPSGSPYNQQNPISGPNIIPQMPNSAYDPFIQEHHLGVPHAMQEPSAGHNNNRPFLQDSRQQQHTVPSPAPPVAAMKPELLAQLASSLLGQQRQSANNPNIPAGDDSRQMNNNIYQSENPDRTSQAQRYHHPLQNNQATPELPMPQYGQAQQFHHHHQQQISNAPPAPQANQQLPSSGAQGEADSDPQKRLQATLQLAAALLQQIQQGKGT